MGHYIHNIDPVIAKVGGFYLWWYGLSYSLGFLGVFFWLKKQRFYLRLSMGHVYTISIFLSSGVLLGGRLVEVVFYEWAYYKSHLYHIPAIWLGGMSTHGILSGGLLGILLYCAIYRKNFLSIADEMAIAGAYIMGVGRIGNFIDGQIVGSEADVFWAVKFPDIEGFRHPVVLYDGIKNLLLIPFLLLIKKSRPARGVILAHFILWYGFLRIFVDFFREYRTSFLGLPPGQEFNVCMTLLGLFLLFLFKRKKRKRDQAGQCKESSIPEESALSLYLKRICFLLLVLMPLVIPSDWTQDVPERYGKRHKGMEHSRLYPQIPLPQQD